MAPNEIGYIILLSLPAYTALISGSLMIRMARLGESPFRRGALVLAIAPCFLAMLVWFSLIIYAVLPEVYVALNSLFFLLYLSIYVISYRFVFDMTKVDPSEEFLKAHYLFPLLGFITMLVWSFFVPYDIQLEIVGARGIRVEGYKWYSIFFYSRIPLLLFMSLICSWLGLRRIMRYRKVVVNYSADEQRGSLSWLYQFIFAMLAIFLAATCVLVVSQNTAIRIWLMFILVVLALFKYAVLAHNVLLENFVVIQADSTGIRSKPEDSDTNRREAIRHLEAYMRKNKPYLNPKFKITDMTGELKTNRTSLSILINRTYGMNFCRYVNRFRLEELERIKSDSRNATLSEQELVAKAGFGDYRGYRRVMQREETSILGPTV